MVMDEKSDDPEHWQGFTSALLDGLERLDTGTTKMEDVWGVTERYRPIVGDAGMLRAIDRIISEIDGFPSSYDDLLKLLRSSPSYAELKAFLEL